MNRLVVVLGIVVLSGATTLVVERYRFRRFWSRACTGASWKAAFPEASKTEIREFLSMFVEAFGFSASRRLRFEPMDRVMEIYQTRYPSSLSVDSLELETLASLARKHYAVDLVPLWHANITLGELFERTRGRAA